MSDRFPEPHTCAECRLFIDDPQQLERMFPGILVLSSCYGSTRGDSGVCTVRDTFQVPEPGCDDFRPRDECFAAVAVDVTQR
jgi:hypothetical protein